MAANAPPAAGRGAADTEVIYKKTDIERDYSILWDISLGTGINGAVVLCVHRKTRKSYALKCLKPRAESKREIGLQWKCRDHPGIVRAIDAYENVICRGPNDPKPPSRMLLLVLELMEEELFDRIMDKKKFTELEASELMREIAEIIHHLHSKNIAHRDLKPENFLYTEKGGGVLKLADFGFAKVDHGDLTTPVFTPYYVPKEILEAQKVYHKKKAGVVSQSTIYAYDKSCDMWSLGVILYIMLCGYPPFQSEIPGTQLSDNMKANIASANFAFHKPHWGHISEAAKSLVSALLTSDSTDRITAEQLVLHPWLQAEQLEEILSGLGSAAGTSADSVVIHSKQTLDAAKRQLTEQNTAMRQDDSVHLKAGTGVQARLKQRSIKAKKAGDRKALMQKRLQYRKDKEAVEAQRKVSKAFFSNDTVFTTQSSKLLGALGAVFKQPPDDLDPSASLAQITLILRTAELERRILQSTLGSICEQDLGTAVDMLKIATRLDKDLTELDCALKMAVTTVPTPDGYGETESVLKPPSAGKVARRRSVESAKAAADSAAAAAELSLPPSPVFSPGAADGADGADDPFSDDEAGSTTSMTRRGKMARMFRSTDKKGNKTERRSSMGRATDRLTMAMAKVEDVKQIWGVPRSAHKGVWLGSALLGKLEDDSDLSSARQTADNLVKTCPNPEKVILITSASTIGVIDAKTRAVLLQTPTSMIFKAVVHSHDPGFFAYVTQNPMLPFRHMHVFSIKRPDEMPRLLRSLPDAGTEEPQDLSASDVSQDPTQSTVTAVRFLGAAPVTSKAWWRAEFKMETNFNKMSMDDLFRSANEILSKPLRALWGGSDTSAHLQNAGVFVSLEEVKVVDALSGQTMKYSIAQIADAVLLDVPKSSARPRGDKESDSPGKHVLPAHMRMNEKQRIAFMAKVKDGNMSVDDAVQSVLSAERDLQVQAVEKIVCFCVKDPKLNTIHIVVMLCTQADTAAQLHASIVRSCEQFTTKKDNPFLELGPMTPTPWTTPKLPPVLLKHELDRKHLIPVQHLGNGEFGDVFLANFYGPDGTDKQCAVKTLRNDKIKSGSVAFLDEALMQLKLKHTNVVECIGVCMMAQPFLVVLEFLLYGDMRAALQVLKEKNVALTAREMVHIADQVAAAMEYISSQRIVHMDLALRNCLLHTCSLVKLADFGVAHVYDEGSDGYTLRGKLKIPFLSCPPETLPEKLWTGKKNSYYAPKFNESTDIWSYGVTLWELMSSGGQPYGTKTLLLELLQQVFNGSMRLAFEKEWPEGLSNIAQRCFEIPAKRPTFEVIRELLLDQLEDLPGGVRDIGALINAPLEKRIKQISNSASVRHREASKSPPTQKDTATSQAAAPAQAQEEGTLKTRPCSAASAGTKSGASQLKINLDDPEASLPSAHYSATSDGMAFVFPDVAAPEAEAALATGISDAAAPKEDATPAIRISDVASPDAEVISATGISDVATPGGASPSTVIPRIVFKQPAKIKSSSNMPDSSTSDSSFVPPPPILSPADEASISRPVEGKHISPTLPRLPSDTPSTSSSGSRFSGMKINLDDPELSLPSPMFALSPNGTSFAFPDPVDAYGAPPCSPGSNGPAPWSVPVQPVQSSEGSKGKSRLRPTTELFDDSDEEVTTPRGEDYLGIGDPQDSPC